jgi:hypothetical protein
VVSLPVTGRYLRRIPGWRHLGGWLLAAGPLTLAVLVGYLASFNLHTVAAGHGIAGLTSRLLVTEVTMWFAALGWHAGRCVQNAFHLLDRRRQPGTRQMLAKRPPHVWVATQTPPCRLGSNRSATVTTAAPS